MKILNEITQIFNNRELSIICWGLVSLIWVLSQKNMRELIRSLIKSFLQKSILISIAIMIIYISILVGVLYYFKIWDTTLLKDTIYWTLGVAFILFFNVNKVIEDRNCLKKIIVNTFKIVIVIEFLSNLYTFNFILELIFLPIILTFSLTSVFLERKDEYKPVKKLSDSLLAIYGIAVVIFSIYHLIKDFDKIVTIYSLKSFLLSPVLTILYLPFLYFMALIMAYESFLKSKKWILKENMRAFKYLKWQVLLKCNFNLEKLRKVSRKLHVYVSIEKDEIKSDLGMILESENPVANSGS